MVGLCAAGFLLGLALLVSLTGGFVRRCRRLVCASYHPEREQVHTHTHPPALPDCVLVSSTQPPTDLRTDCPVFLLLMHSAHLTLCFGESERRQEASDQDAHPGWLLAFHFLFSDLVFPGGIFKNSRIKMMSTDHVTRSRKACPLLDTQSVRQTGCCR